MTLLGIDVGGTKVVLVVGDREGRPLARLRRPMSRTGDWRRDVDELIADARRLLADAPGAGSGRLEAIGLSVPGPVDAPRGVLRNPPNLVGWRDVPIGRVLSQALDAPARVENDANAAVLAEHRFGAGRGVDDLVYLTMSTGVGGGVIAGGRLVRGAFGGADEAGHIPIEPGGRVCACGLRGCLEAYVGGHAWRDRLREVVPASSLVVEIVGGDREQVGPEALLEAARRADAFALEELGRWLDRLAQGLAAIVMLLEPRRVVLGTIAAAAGEALCFAPLRARLAERLWPHQLEQLEIVPSALGEDLPALAGLAVALPDPAEA